MRLRLLPIRSTRPRRPSLAARVWGQARLALGGILLAAVLWLLFALAFAL